MMLSNCMDEFKELIENNIEVLKLCNMIDFKYEIIEKLYDYLKENDITIKEFAKKVRIKPRIIRKFMIGNHDIKLSDIEKIIYEIDYNLELYKENSIMNKNNEKMLKIKKELEERIEKIDYNIRQNELISGERTLGDYVETGIKAGILIVLQALEKENLI